MLNRQAICFGTFCVLFIASAVFAQTDTIIEKIFESETRVREHVNQEVKGIETKISAVDTKVDNLNTKVGTLSTVVTENKTNIVNMKEDIRDLKGAADRIWYGILGILGTLILSILSIVGFFLRSWWQNRGNADNVDAVDRLAKQISDLISTQAENSETRYVSGDPKVLSVERVNELTDNIRSPHRDAGEAV